MTRPTDEEGLLRHLAGRAAAEGRTICAIVGPPGSGKSTLAESLARRLDEQAPGSAAVLPMDGFHYDDLWLVPAGLRPRKGAPETFDVAGLRHLLTRLRAGEDGVFVPVFDRDLEIARAGARPIPASVRLILCEGNWLLLDRDPWRSLHPFFDLTIRIDVPEPVLRRRLRARWEGYGLSEEEIAWKLDGNDLPNGRLVAAGSIPADLVLHQEG